MKNKSLGYVIYVIYNIILLILILWLLLFALMYLNGAIVPNSLKWLPDGTLRKNLSGFNLVHILVIFIEGLLLVSLTYLLNKRFLKGIIKETNYKRVALFTWTISLLLVLILAYCEIFI